MVDGISDRNIEYYKTYVYGYAWVEEFTGCCTLTDLGR